MVKSFHLHNGRALTRSMYLQFVDIGGVASAAAELDGSFAAAIRNNPLVLLDPHAVGPVRVIVAATTFELNK